MAGELIDEVFVFRSIVAGRQIGNLIFSVSKKGTTNKINPSPIG
jgi:hypothetical protein